MFEYGAATHTLATAFGKLEFRYAPSRPQKHELRPLILGSVKYGARYRY
jgi:hypothetical protein